MSNTLPFIMSSSPPPIDDCDEEEDDEFGDFRVADISFSLSDLNKPSDSLENGKSWIEPTTKIKENELQSSDIAVSVSSTLPNDTPSLAVNNEIEYSQLESVKNFPESNGITPGARDSSFFVTDNQRKEASDFLYHCADTKNVSSDKSNVSIPEEVISDTNLENEIEKSTNGLGVELCSISQCEIVKEVDRTDNFENTNDDNKKELDTVSDDFSDFADFTNRSGLSDFQNATNYLQPVLHVTDPQDDFDDFESAEFEPCTVEEPSFEETLKMMFQVPKKNEDSRPDIAEITDSLHLCLDDSSSVWGNLKELETSHALSYQWSNSTANKTLLSSLNIDCRNIIFGARWNLCVPRFAANLGLNPLEPVKAVETASFSPVTSVTGTSSMEEVVPAAQFDWTSSGLTNPLDASQLTLVDLDFFTKFDDISSSYHAASSFWKLPSLEKENTSSTAESAMPNVVETSEAEPGKAVIDDFFGSISDEVVNKNTEEESMVMPLPISSVSDLAQKKMSAEAFMVVESFPDLSFLSARKLMQAADENMSRWRVKP